MCKIYHILSVLSMKIETFSCVRMVQVELVMFIDVLCHVEMRALHGQSVHPLSIALPGFRVH